MFCLVEPQLRRRGQSLWGHVWLVRGCGFKAQRAACSAGVAVERRMRS